MRTLNRQTLMLLAAGALCAPACADLDTPETADTAPALSEPLDDIAETSQALHNDVALKDFNGDHRPDILWYNNSTQQLSAWIMDYTKVTSTPVFAQVAADGWLPGGTGDFDRNNETDILWFKPSTGQVSVWFMDDRTFLRSALLSTTAPSGWQPRGTGDFNNDRRTDIVWWNVQSGQVSVWLLDGTDGTHVKSTPLVTATVPAGGGGWDLAGTGDFNLDTRSDLVWYNAGTGQVVMWLLDGVTLSSSPALSFRNPPGTPVRLVGTGDFFNNGTGVRSSDLLWYWPQTGKVETWILDKMTFQKSLIMTASAPTSGAWQPAQF